MQFGVAQRSPAHRTVSRVTNLGGPNVDHEVEIVRAGAPALLQFRESFAAMVSVELMNHLPRDARGGDRRLAMRRMAGAASTVLILPCASSALAPHDDTVSRT